MLHQSLGRLTHNLQKVLVARRTKILPLLTWGKVPTADLNHLFSPPMGWRPRVQLIKRGHTRHSIFRELKSTSLPSSLRWPEKLSCIHLRTHVRDSITLPVTFYANM